VSQLETDLKHALEAKVTSENSSKKVGKMVFNPVLGSGESLGISYDGVYFFCCTRAGSYFRVRFT